MLDVFKIVNWLRVKNHDDLENGIQEEHLTQLRTMKLLYYMQAASLVIRKQPLYNDPILAWKYGPVILAVHNKYAGQREISKIITKQDRDEFTEIQNSPQIVSLLNKVYLTYRNTKDFQLVNKTHREKPWQITDQNTEIKRKNIEKEYKNNFNDKDWRLIKTINQADSDSLAYTVAKQKLEKKGLIPSSIHDVKNEDDFWKQFEA